MRFADQWNARQGAFNQHFGEQVRVEPMVVGNYASNPDVARPVIETIAILRFGDDARQLMSGDHESNRVRGRIGVQHVDQTRGIAHGVRLHRDRHRTLRAVKMFRACASKQPGPPREE